MNRTTALCIEAMASSAMAELARLRALVAPYIDLPASPPPLGEDAAARPSPAAVAPPAAAATPSPRPAATELRPVQIPAEGAPALPGAPLEEALPSQTPPASAPKAARALSSRREDAALSPTAEKVYQALVAIAERDGSTPNSRALGELAGVPEGSVIYALGVLEKRGRLKVSGFGAAKTFKLTLLGKTILPPAESSEPVEPPKPVERPAPALRKRDEPMPAPTSYRRQARPIAATPDESREAIERFLAEKGATHCPTAVSVAPEHGVTVSPETRAAHETLAAQREADRVADHQKRHARKSA